MQIPLFPQRPPLTQLFTAPGLACLSHTPGSDTLFSHRNPVLPNGQVHTPLVGEHVPPFWHAFGLPTVCEHCGLQLLLSVPLLHAPALSSSSQQGK